MLFPHPFEALSYKTQGILPGGFLKDAVLSDQGGFEALRMVDEVPAETAFDTEVPVIGTIGGSMRGSIGCGVGEDTLDAPFLGAEGEQATAGTVRAGGRRLGQFSRLRGAEPQNPAHPPRRLP